VTRDFTERKRTEEVLLLEITNVLVSKLDIRELLAALSSSLSRVRPHHYANLAFQEPETKQLRVLVVGCPYEEDPIHQGVLLPLEGSPSGLAFRSGKPLLLNHIDGAGASPSMPGTNLSRSRHLSRTDDCRARSRADKSCSHMDCLAPL
jgi:formate hydrogenlyase transcriptional activator